MIEIRDAVLEDLPSMLEIYNEAVLNTTSTFDIKEQTLEQRKNWFQKYGGRYPLIVATSNEEVLGYSSLSPFREKEAYANTAELSIYISTHYRRMGIGSHLMGAIISRAKGLGYHTIVSCISVENEASMRLHEKFGFQFIGRLKEVGYKFGSWKDVSFYQLIFSEDAETK